MSPIKAVAVLGVFFATSVYSQQVDFARDIQPILNAKCLECHGGVKAAGDLSFVYENRVINYEADTGAVVVVPGKPNESELFRRISSKDDFEVMPQPAAHPPLSAEQVGLIRKWIEQGAKWSGHWAYAKPKATPAGKSKFDSLAKNEIDRYLFARLEQENQKPAVVQSPGRLLRRLSIGLTGIPPTLGQIEAFELAFRFDVDRAVENAVDRLIDSPAFGERWASMWLDVVRYADSGGLGHDQRRSIWVYRDWVVRAFNQNMPFDQFTIKQLAGDLLPKPTLDDLVATACHRNTQTNNEGGTDDEEFRIEAVIDRVNTTWQAWGGVTFGCVQCHDHPYDPFRHEEYYQFADFFNGSADSDVGNDGPRIRVPTDRRRFDQWESLDRQWKNLRNAIFNRGSNLRDQTQWTPVEQLVASSQNGVKYVLESKDDVVQFHTAGTISHDTQTLLNVSAADLPQQPLTAIKLAVLPLDPATALHSPEWGFWLTDLKAFCLVKKGDTGDLVRKEIKFRWSVPDYAWMPTDPFVRVGPNGENWSAHSRIHRERQLVLVPADPIQLEGVEQLRIEISCGKMSGDAHPLIVKRGHLAVTTDPRWTDFAQQDSPVRVQHAQVNELRQKIEKLGGTHTPVMAERPDHLQRPTHVFVRGNMMDKGVQVFAALPDSLLGLSQPRQPDSSGLDRLDMARWWVSPENPLTARVFVNRVWAQLFGVGIVPTLEDFGSSGDKPTHPELLDYLAIRFQHEHQWRVKSLVREIALSYVYRQSAKASAELHGRDPGNRLLARGPQLRLSAEAVRDNMLAVSGLLSGKVGGSPVRPPIPSGIWNPFDVGDRWDTAKRGDDNRYRRSIYVYVKRSIPFPAFATFDAPSREFCTPRRLTSNTPLQALFTLNGEAFVECAEAFGKRIQTELSGSLEVRLAKAHVLATGREPSEERAAQLLGLHRDLQKRYAELKQQAAKKAMVEKQKIQVDVEAQKREKKAQRKVQRQAKATSVNTADDNVDDVQGKAGVIPPKDLAVKAIARAKKQSKLPKAGSGEKTKSNPIDYEQMVWTVIGQVLLNMDEAMTY